MICARPSNRHNVKWCYVGTTFGSSVNPIKSSTLKKYGVFDLRCVLSPSEQDALTVAAMLSVQNPFVHPRGGGRERRERVREAMEEFAVTEGDHITYLNVFNSFDDAGNDSEWCKENCLNHRTLVRAGEIRQQLSRCGERNGVGR